METPTLVMIGTVVIGIIGAIVFFASQPAPAKKRSAGGSLKPRGERQSSHQLLMRNANLRLPGSLPCKLPGAVRRGPLRAMSHPLQDLSPCSAKRRARLACTRAVLFPSSMWTAHTATALRLN
jgi:hypothetical protein